MSEQLTESEPLSPELRELEDWKRCAYFQESEHHGFVELVTKDLFDAFCAEFRARMDRDRAFVRRVCKERGFDIDELAKDAPEYA